MNLLAAIAAFAIAWLLCLIITPWLAILARRLGVLDNPDGYRKSQQRAVTTGGGVAVAISAASGAALAVQFIPQSAWIASSPILVGLLQAALVLICVGLVDDILGLTGIYKLVGQILAVSQS